MSEHEKPKRPPTDKERVRVLRPMAARLLAAACTSWSESLKRPVSPSPSGPVPVEKSDAKRLGALSGPLVTSAFEAGGGLTGRLTAALSAADAAALCGAHAFDPAAWQPLADALGLAAGRVLGKGAEGPSGWEGGAPAQVEKGDQIEGSAGTFLVSLAFDAGDRKALPFHLLLSPDLVDGLASLHGIPAPEAAPAPGAKPKILAVDDQYALRTLLKRHLESAGFQAVLGENGAEALRILNRERVDLAIFDVMMPGMDGMELCRQVRKLQDANAKIPIIMCTGKGQKQDVIDALSAGANDYVVKPFTGEILIAKIRKALSAPPS